MTKFLRFFFPTTYFQATRLNRWALIGFNALVEWLPAILLSLFYNNFAPSIVVKVALSYLAFICIYEIGYITNDFISEKFEEDPRGRSSQLDISNSVMVTLIVTRLLFFWLFTYLLGAMTNPLWWAFHAALALTFALHNSLPNAFRIPTFFGLSAYRFFAPVILTLDLNVLTILLPAIMLNHCLYRITAYLGTKNIFVAENRQGVRFKLAFYAGCLPLSAIISLIVYSPIPLVVCIYFIFVWLLYWLISKIIGRELF